ncbi:stage III sporulation protein AA [Oceanobacillus chungangensis]|uniref:Stage III sporulation protein AA n=1 Tax=Oceanobacillus chungangensis TaxID=1229152 RepID=A0A3D8Q104_9BACI|nr:stage III sporulation protein AA [Oceanobacillus chungangensis]RDW21954.1 stage III sporulation protein AA [Oceanobacillus chungangensis]
MEEILRLFPPKIRQAVEKKVKNRWNILQEIRIRIDKPMELSFDMKTEWIGNERPNQQDGLFIVNQLSAFSLYRMEDELREGYITIEGGHRVGIAGKVNTLKGSVKAIQHITFFNIRIAKEKIGAAISLLPYMYERNYLNTLIIGPPQTGKTTLIRDITRLIATGWKKVEAKKVGVIDERSEIAASIRGVPQHDIGLRTDVLDACPKAEGLMMMIRSMSPDVLIVDEIGSKEDIAALIEAINAGVTIVCSIHGQDLDELKKRPSLQILFEQNVFQRMILLERKNRPAQVQRIYDENEINILKKSRYFANEVDRSTSFHRYNYMDGV